MSWFVGVFLPFNTGSFFTIDVHQVFLEVKFRICRKGNKDALNIFFFLKFQHILFPSTDFEVLALLENQFQKSIWLQLHRSETTKLVEPCNIGMLYWAGALLGCLLCSHTARCYSDVAKGCLCYLKNICSHITREGTAMCISLGRNKFTYNVSKVLLCYTENEA